MIRSELDARAVTVTNEKLIGKRSIATDTTMLTRVAPVVAQDRVEDSPDRMLVGVASNRTMAGLETSGVTVTVTVAR